MVWPFSKKSHQAYRKSFHSRAVKPFSNTNANLVILKSNRSRGSLLW